jgi:hypothetical protein
LFASFLMESGGQRLRNRDVLFVERSRVIQQLAGCSLSEMHALYDA